MSKHPFSQLIQKSTPQAQGVLTSHGGSMTRKHNAEIVRNFLTEGDTTVADFIVTPLRSAMHSFIGVPQTQTHGRCLQLRKEGV